MSVLLEVLIYAAALDLYAKSNRREVYLNNRLSIAMLKTVEWTARPYPLTQEVP